MLQKKNTLLKKYNFVQKPDFDKICKIESTLIYRKWVTQISDFRAKIPDFDFKKMDFETENGLLV